MTRRIYMVLGEASGDALAADLVQALRRSNRDVEITGLAGDRLQAMGVRSLFDIEDVAVMGISAVIGRLPTIVRRVRQVVSDIVRTRPDAVVLVDSPDFTHAVAKRVRQRCPDIPIIGYVSPSVWAWRPGRARAMSAYIDHQLAILPFEPAELERLGGPPTTYVGHRLARHVASLPGVEKPEGDPILLVLPGSRSGEIKRMLALYGRTLDVLRARGAVFRTVIPAVGHVRAAIERETATWRHAPIIVPASENDRTFAIATAALATSGTVTLELALHGVPMVTGYKLDPVARPFAGLISIWSALLPNLIADRMIVPEEVNELVLPGRLARHLEELLTDTPMRQRQLDGFEQVRQAMETTVAPGDRGAQIILDLLAGRTP